MTIEDCVAFSELPDLGGLKSLEELIIGQCKSLKSLSIHLPISLKILDLHSCKCLQKIPNLSQLKNLEVLRIKECEELVVIPALGELESLQQLFVASCKSLKIFVAMPACKLESSEQNYQNPPRLKNLRELSNGGV